MLYQLGAGIVAYGTLTPDNIGNISVTDWTGSGNMYIWDFAFQHIRKINIFLEKMPEITVELENKDRMIAETRFLRAYIYFMLLQRFGEAPIVEESYELNTEVTFTSASFNECLEFIEEDIAAALPELPVTYATTESNFGRATQAACHALLSRVYLYAASPLFNKDNSRLKWEKASAAARLFLDTYPQYELYPDYT
ncbi:MAG: RagB/SusD family nutrient uptake outer membrane protein [Bacteroides sp.]|nr:RagB/SusD family nutrient uptake outer membrane protein [Bacteroides sp.]